MSRKGICNQGERAMTLAEVAAVMGEKVTTIGMIEQRALQKLRVRMQGVRASDYIATEIFTDNNQLVHFDVELTPEVL